MHGNNKTMHDALTVNKNVKPLHTSCNVKDMRLKHCGIKEWEKSLCTCTNQTQTHSFNKHFCKEHNVEKCNTN